MPQVNSRSTFKDYCMRQLGWPVLEINIDDDQVDDRVDEALQYFQQFHFDATERTYLKHQITQDDINNNYVGPIANNVVGITRIFPVSVSTGRINMFDIRYQLRLQDLQTFTGSGSITNYWLINTHLRLLDMIFNGETPIRFNRHTDRLYIDWAWSRDIAVNDYIIMEAFVTADPDEYNKVWNDRMLKKLATAYLKRQWASNLKKASGIQLPGNITLDGQSMYNEAVAEVTQLEEEIRDTYQEPPMFLVG